MKKYILSMLVLLCVNTLNAQMRWLITANAGATTNFWNPEPFNKFVDSYNNDPGIKAATKTPLSRFKGTVVGFSRGFGTILEPSEKSSIGMEFNKCVFTQNSTSFFNNNSGREIKLRFVTWNFNFDFSRKFGKFLDAGLLFGVSMRSGTVYSYALYGNADNRSTGAEFWLNGIYKGIVQNDFNLGINLRFNILKYLSIQARAYRSFIWAAGSDRYLSAFSDASPGKNMYSEYFPTDFTLFEDNVQAAVYDYENNVIPNHFKGWYAQVSVLFKLNLTKNK